MAKFKYLDIDVAAWIRDTYHLRPVARGIYMDLVMLAWSEPKCRLRNDIDWLAKRLLYTSEEIPILSDICEQFWKPDRRGKWLHQGRLDKEWQASEQRREHSLVNAKSRWDNEKKHNRIARTVTVTGTALRNSPTGNSSNAVPARATKRAPLRATRSSAAGEEINPYPVPGPTREQRLKEAEEYFRQQQERSNGEETKH